MSIRDCTRGVGVLSSCSGIPVIPVLSLRGLLLLLPTLVVVDGNVDCAFPLSMAWCAFPSGEVVEKLLVVLLRDSPSWYGMNDVGLGPRGGFRRVGWVG
jgi:hypothetical protein